MSIAENLKTIHSQISTTCLKAGRTADACSLVAVSKTKPASDVREAMAAGQLVFGENYVQEAIEKISALPSAEWHFIGNLQSNKVAQVVGHFSLIHSVDRLSLAQAISKDALKKNLVQNILMQINVGYEDSKSGVSFEEAPALREQIGSLPNLKLCGFMCLPPLSDEFEQQRGYFRALKEFANESNSQGNKTAILSMGTTHDFEAAIFEGATHVRIGTAIFGARN